MNPKVTKLDGFCLGFFKGNCFIRTMLCVAPDSIEINKEKGLATYSVAVSQGKDKEPAWYNCTTFNTKLLETLQNIKESGKGSQVTLKVSIQKIL